MKKIKELICQIFGHNWERKFSLELRDEVYVCKRCGEQFHSYGRR